MSAKSFKADPKLDLVLECVVDVPSALVWKCWTEPKHTPEDLIRRGYSIHVNYFTPESFRSAARVLEERGWFDRVFVYTAPNHKDFAFALRRS